MIQTVQGLMISRALAKISRAAALLLLMGVQLLAGCTGDKSSNPSINFIELPGARGLLPSMSTANAAFESAHYSGNGVCEACHTDTAVGDARRMVVQTEAGFKDVSIGLAWESSTMAQSARDPYWHAVVAAELNRYPTLADEINDTCTRCHAPMANDLAKKDNLDLQVFDTGSSEDGTLVKGIYTMGDEDALFNHAMDGVSCALCHQIEPGNLGDPSSMTGGYVVTPWENAEDRLAYGQYENPDVVYMKQTAEFTPQHGPHMSDSAVCATCHNLTTTPVDANGEPLADVTHFAEQMMYTEWQLSDYATGGPLAATCQDCHMPKLDKPVPLASAGADTPRDEFAEHTFLAANTVMQSMMSAYQSELGIDPGIDFAPAIERNREFLKTAATLALQDGALSDNELSFDVVVTNTSGHKLPSGYHSRRAYLHVLVTNASGEVVYENGRIDAQTGAIAGVSEDVNPANFEIHYDEIVDETQVQVYQAIVGNPAGERTHSLLDGTGYLKDNRLTPLGFDKNSVPADVAVAGDALNDDDFNNGVDTVTYKVAVDGEGAYNVLVELRYQPFAYGHLIDLFAEFDQIDQVDMFRTIYDNTTLRDEIITTTTGTIQ